MFTLALIGPMPILQTFLTKLLSLTVLSENDDNKIAERENPPGNVKQMLTSYRKTRAVWD